MLARPRGGAWALYPTGGGAPQPLPFLAAGDRPLRFGGHALFVQNETNIVSVDVESDARTIVHPRGAPPPGNVYTTPPVVSADGRAYAYTYNTVSTQLFVVEGLRQLALFSAAACSIASARLTAPRPHFPPLVIL